MQALEHTAAVASLGETLCKLRLRTEDALRHMRLSLERHGQLTAVAVYRDEAGVLEVLDGFKRLSAARTLRLDELRVRVVADDPVQAKVALSLLNASQGLSELEEAWVIRSLYRDDGLSQPEIGRLLGRHKSWVCRRLVLAEALEDTVQADVRLGLLAARTACILGRLPRGNQRAAADCVMRRGMTSAQTQSLVWSLLECHSESARAELLADFERSAPPDKASRLRPRTPAEWILTDTAAVTRLCARLQARLLERPLSALGVPTAALLSDALAGLVPVLGALARRINVATGKEKVHAIVEHARGACEPGGGPVPPGAGAPGDRAGARGEPQYGAQDP